MDRFVGNNGSQDGCAAKMTPLDPEELRRQGHIMVDFIADYYKNVEKYPVRSQVEPGYLRQHLPRSAPYSAETMETILKDVQELIVPGLTHWQSPNHFAYYQANTSTAGFLGEMLCTGFNVVGFSWISSPAATELENIVMDWLGDMVSLPKSFLFSGGGGGAIHTSTCEAILCTIVTARDEMLRKIGRENARKLVVYGSDQTHSAFPKAAKIAGIDPSNIRSILTTKSTEYSLSPSSLKEQILKDLEAGLVPLFVCANVGSTSTSAVDPLVPICDIAKDYGIWVHVDAAYAGSACICPEFRQVIDGVEGADSFSFNAHKWLFSCMDCCCLWLKNPSVLVKTLSSEFECLKYKVAANNNNDSSNEAVPVDYKDWQIALSRRFRALKLWMVLRYYGVSNLRSFIRNHVEMARHFEKLVNMDKRFEVVAPVNFSLVCFRVSPSAFGLEQQSRRHDDEKISMEEYVNKFNSDLLECINATGKVFMIHAIVGGGVYAIRFAVGATLAEYRHIDMAWKVVQEHASSMLEEHYKNLSL